MRHKYTLVMVATDYGHRQYYVTRAEELALSHNTDDNLDIFFRRLTDFLNESDPESRVLQDRIIELRWTNKSLMNLIRAMGRKLLWSARRITDEGNRTYAFAVAAKFRESADEIEKEVLERGSNSGKGRPAEGHAGVDGVHEQEQELPEPE